MEVKKKILAIFRILEASPHRDKNRYYETIRNLEKLLSPEDKKVMFDVMKVYLLLTAGNQEAIRDPSKFDEAGAKDNFSSMMSQKTYLLYRDLDMEFEIMDPPTKADYELAHKLLPIIGSASITKDDIDAQIGSTGDLDRRFASEGHDVVYRGLHNMSNDVIKFLLTKPVWDLKRGVSTSYDEREAHRFAKIKSKQKDSIGSGFGPAILFTIDNVSKRGFHAGSLSRYSREKEVILSGDIQVTDYTVEIMGDVMPKNGIKESIKILASSRAEVIGFYWTHPGKRVPMFERISFSDKEGGSFTGFLGSLLDTKKSFITVGDEKWEVEIDYRSFLVKANATLP